MNAGTLQLISIIAFSLAGVLTLISIYLFLKMDVRGIIDDLSGKSAERQIMAMREEVEAYIENMLESLNE